MKGHPTKLDNYILVYGVNNGAKTPLDLKSGGVQKPLPRLGSTKLDKPYVAYVIPADTGDILMHAQLKERRAEVVYSVWSSTEVEVQYKAIIH